MLPVPIPMTPRFNHTPAYVQLPIVGNRLQIELLSAVDDFSKTFAEIKHITTRPSRSSTASTRAVASTDFSPRFSPVIIFASSLSVVATRSVRREFLRLRRFISSCWHTLAPARVDRAPQTYVTCMLYSLFHFRRRFSSSKVTGSMQAAAEQWDLTSMELEELLTEKTVLFVAKVSVGHLLGIRRDLDHVSTGSWSRQKGSRSGTMTIPANYRTSVLDLA